MNVLERVSPPNVDQFFEIGRKLTVSSFAGINKFVHSVESAIADATIRDKRIMASHVAKKTINGTIVRQDEYMLDKVTNILMLLGYTELATELAHYTNKTFRSAEYHNDMLNELIDGAIKKSRSDAASGYRHKLHDEIVAIMKATWKKNAALSKKKMISKLKVRYGELISDDTLSDWIKKEKLLPPAPKKYINSDLVIPAEYM